jgi:hypothetical protein
LIVLWIVVLALAGLAGVAGASPATSPPPLPPGSSIPQMPKGSQTRCTMSGPAWAEWGIHTPNAPPRRGNRYLVTAWGIPCSQAMARVRAFFPKVPPYSTGQLSGGPKGFTCKGRASGLEKNRMYMGSCVRLKPAAMFFWETTGGKRG